MAIQSADNTQATTSTNGNKKKADGYLNLKLKDRHGNYHNIQCYIPLDKQNAVHRALLNNAEDGSKEFDIVGHVNVAKDESIEIEL